MGPGGPGSTCNWCCDGFFVSGVHLRLLSVGRGRSFRWS